MGQITSGVVKYGRTINLGDYNSKRADVEIAFASEDGSDLQKMVDLAGTTAIAKVHELLALAERPAAAATGARAATAGPAATTGPVKTKDELAAEALKAAGSTAPKEPKPPKKPPAAPAAPASTPAADPAAIEEPTKPAESVADDSLDDLLGDGEPAKSITDEEITGAISRINGKIKNPIAIRALINEFVPAPGQARQIAADKRAAFLQKLETLKPAG